MVLLYTLHCVWIYTLIVQMSIPLINWHHSIIINYCHLHPSSKQSLWLLSENTTFKRTWKKRNFMTVRGTLNLTYKFWSVLVVLLALIANSTIDELTRINRILMKVILMNIGGCYCYTTLWWSEVALSGYHTKHNLNTLYTINQA